MPYSRARSIIAKLACSSARGPKFIVPRQTRLTCRPVRPSEVYCIMVVSQYTLAQSEIRTVDERTLCSGGLCLAGAAQDLVPSGGYWPRRRRLSPHTAGGLMQPSLGRAACRVLRG